MLLIQICREIGPYYRTSVHHWPTYRSIPKKRSTQSWMMTSFLLSDCSRGEYGGPKGAMSSSILSGGKVTQKRKILGRMRWTYMMTWSRNMRAESLQRLELLLYEGLLLGSTSSIYMWTRSEIVTAAAGWSDLDTKWHTGLYECLCHRAHAR